MLRSIIESGELGALKAVHSRLYMGQTKPPAQVLWHDGTHLVDIITFLAGPWDITTVQGDPDDTENPFIALGKTRDRKETALVTLDCSRGGTFSALSWMWSFPRGGSGPATVSGTSGGVNRPPGMSRSDRSARHETGTGEKCGKPVTSPT